MLASFCMGCDEHAQSGADEAYITVTYMVAIAGGAAGHIASRSIVDPHSALRQFYIVSQRRLVLDAHDFTLTAGGDGPKLTDVTRAIDGSERMAIQRSCALFRHGCP